jgi:hypothetical protein
MPGGWFDPEALLLSLSVWLIAPLILAALGGAGMMIASRLRFLHRLWCKDCRTLPLPLAHQNPWQDIYREANARRLLALYRWTPRRRR